MTADVEMCDWWPEQNKPAEGIPGPGATWRSRSGCPNQATLSVGVSNNGHLCGSCADLPRFKRMKRRDLKKASV